MGQIVFGEQSTKKVVEFTFSNETNVANPKEMFQVTRVRVPKGVAPSRILHRELIAESVIQCVPFKSVAEWWI